jgi:hypothetical protein
MASFRADHMWLIVLSVMTIGSLVFAAYILRRVTKQREEMHVKKFLLLFLNEQKMKK